ncbi:MAG: flagellin [Phycisphaerales bacterium]|nr:flagellin [Phycisphaerales bacterium]
MALTVNNLQTLSILTLLNKNQRAQDAVTHQMTTGYRINRGADDPAGLLALSKLDSELTAVNAGIASNQRTDAMLSVADDALGQISTLVGEIQRLASESANNAALSADEVAANQSQIDDALASIDRIVNSTNFNGKKMLDGSLGIQHNTTVKAGDSLTDVRIFSRKATTDATTLTVAQTAAAEQASGGVIKTGSAGGVTAKLSVQGKKGAAVIEIASNDTWQAIRDKVNAATAQTGVYASAAAGTSAIRVYSSDFGADAFVRTKLIEGGGFADVSDSGKDAVVTVNGQATSVDGKHVAYTGGGISLSFEVGTLTSTASILVKPDGNGKSGATFQLGTNADTRATLGIDGAYTAQLGTAADGYLRSLGSGGANSLVSDPAQAAKVADLASQQVATLRGRIGGFQKFQVRTAIDSLSSAREGLEKAKSVVRDLDYAQASAELNRQNILMQSALGLLSLTNQQSAQVLSLLR